MLIISFSWTTPAVVAEVKRVTRRDWDREYAKFFTKNMLCQAYDKSPRVGGKQFGVIKLTREPYLESTAIAPAIDYRLEGFEHLTRIGATVQGMTPAELWDEWHVRPQVLYVVRFRLVELTKYGEVLRMEPKQTKMT